MVRDSSAVEAAKTEPMENPMTAIAMPADEFWEIIERAALSNHDPAAHVQALRTELHQLTLEEIISFQVAFRGYLNRAYTWDLWGAAYVVHGGCSDDGFEYFRRWLVSQGRKAYEAAMVDADSLARLDVRSPPPDVWEFEEFYYVAMEVFKQKGGQGDVREYSESEAGLGGPGPTGDEFEDDEDHLSKRYPKLWARFGSAPLG